MERAAESTIQIKRTIIVGLIVVPLLSGFAAVANILGDPRSQNIRSLDVVRLVAIGACAGVAFTGLALLVRSKFRRG